MSQCGRILYRGRLVRTSFHRAYVEQLENWLCLGKD